MSLLTKSLAFLLVLGMWTPPLCKSLASEIQGDGQGES